MILYKNRKTHYWFSVSIVLVLSPALLSAAAASSEDKKQTSVVAAIFGGGVAAAADVFASQPFEVQKQYKMSLVNPAAPKMQKPTSLRGWYCGSGVQLLNFGAVTALQTSCNEWLKQFITENDTTGKIERSVISGVLSAPISSATGAVRIRMQDANLSALDAWIEIFKQGGCKAFVRACPAVAVREGLFTSGYLGAYGITKDYCKVKAQTLPVPDSVKEVLAVSVASVLLGVPIACVSQLFDVCANRMQTDVSGKTYTGTMQTFRVLYQQGLLNNYVKGLSPRTASVVIGIGLMGTTADFVTNYIDRLVPGLY